MVFIHGQAFLVLHDLPEHCIGDEIAVVGLTVAVAVGGLRAIELHFALGEDRAVLLVDAVDDLLRGSGNGRVLGGVFLDLVEGVALDLLARIVDDDHADIGELRTGGLDGLAVLALSHHTVGVTVDDEVDTFGRIVEVIGGIGLGRIIHTEVGKRDDDIVILERFKLLFGDCLEVGVELETLDERGVGLGLRFGRLETEEADLHAALLDDGVGIENGLAVGVEHVGAQNFELGGLHVLRQLGIAVVELMVADGGHIVAGGVHHRHRVRALMDADVDGALTVVAGVGQNDLGALGLIVGLQGCHGRIQVDRTVHVVRVQDDGLAGERLCLVSCKCRARQTQDQAQHQQQRKQFLRVLHVISSIF